MTGTAAAGPASTESARLIALANVLASQAGDWQRLGRPLAIVGDDSGEPLPAQADDLAAMLVEFEVT